MSPLSAVWQDYPFRGIDHKNPSQLTRNDDGQPRGPLHNAIGVAESKPCIPQAGVSLASTRGTLQLGEVYEFGLRRLASVFAGAQGL
jgi:hypothetical protein